ncbi:hypothetical protein KIN20_004298 [Parelaphostrongylus tenuis]|uniref:FHA domain-containing protein n=1 Tax=Parelaphostrongylus tenuis TaxID=148309 RepID=A0AAD5M1H3_PARTN|nr:hypothetical protein KIN20_004298 [Parelaphostrongylus tenuis]
MSQCDLHKSMLYTIGSIGETVSIGRDRKCGIALAIDAQGVSRIHGFLKWSAQEVSSLTSTACQNKQVSALLHNQPVN